MYRRLRARDRSCLCQIELFALLVISVCRVCADTCALWAVVAASIAYTSFFFVYRPGREGFGLRLLLLSCFPGSPHSRA